MAELTSVGSGSEEQIRVVSASLAEMKVALNQKKIYKDENAMDLISCQDNLNALQKKHR